MRKLNRPCSVKFTDGRSAKATGIGNIRVPGLRKQQALLISLLSETLMSVRVLTDNGETCKFIPDQSRIVCDGKVTIMDSVQGVYNIPQNASISNRACSASSSELSPRTRNLWHQRMAHPGDYAMQRIGCGNKKNDGICEICQQGKQQRFQFNATNNRHD